MPWVDVTAPAHAFAGLPALIESCIYSSLRKRTGFRFTIICVDQGILCIVLVVWGYTNYRGSPLRLFTGV